MMLKKIVFHRNSIFSAVDCLLVVIVKVPSEKLRLRLPLRRFAVRGDLIVIIISIEIHLLSQLDQRRKSYAIFHLYTKLLQTDSHAIVAINHPQNIFYF